MNKFTFFRRQGFRLFSVFTVLAVFFCTLAGYQTFVSADVSVPSNITVGLFYGSSAKTSVKITSERGYYAGVFNDRVFLEREKL